MMGVSNFIEICSVFPLIMLKEFFPFQMGFTFFPFRLKWMNPPQADSSPDFSAIFLPSSRRAA
jgi:hypothetical protein